MKKYRVTVQYHKDYIVEAENESEAQHMVYQKECCVEGADVTNVKPEEEED